MGSERVSSGLHMTPGCKIDSRHWPSNTSRLEDSTQNSIQGFPCPASRRESSKSHMVGQHSIVQGDTVTFFGDLPQRTNSKKHPSSLTIGTILNDLHEEVMI